MFFRLWTRAPLTTILSFDMAPMFSAYAQVSPTLDEPGAPGWAHRLRAPLQNAPEATAETSDYKWFGAEGCRGATEPRFMTAIDPRQISRRLDGAPQVHSLLKRMAGDLVPDVVERLNYLRIHRTT